MRTREWTRLTMMAMGLCLAGGMPALLAGPSTLPVQTQPASLGDRVQLEAITYPDGVGDERQYEQYLGSKMRESAQNLVHPAESPGVEIDRSLEVADFALTRVIEPELTRVWLWRQAAGKSELPEQALRVAQSALLVAGGPITHGNESPATDTQRNRIHVLQSLLGMEKALLAAGHGEEALRAANAADAAAEKVRPGGRATWDVLIAGCLAKAGLNEDAQVRLTGVLRRYKGSRAALVAGLLQVRMLAEAGRDVAAISLASEYALALPGMAAATQPSEGDGAGAADGKVAKCSLLVLKAEILKQWADKLARSEKSLDRQAAEPVRQQADVARTEAQEVGRQVARLGGMLEAAATP